MCGIFAVFGFSEEEAVFRRKATQLSKKYSSLPRQKYLAVLIADNVIALSSLGYAIEALTGVVSKFLERIFYATSDWLSLVLVRGKVLLLIRITNLHR
jgi:hypothetical protein